MNPYKIHIERFFKRQIELRHFAYIINSNLSNSIRNIETTKINTPITFSALVISDWTCPIDSDWVINYHTGISKVVFKKNYKEEIERIISGHCCFSFSQSFEALEKFFKDCLYEFATRNIDFQKSIKIPNDKPFKRENLPGGEKLFNYIKKVCNPGFTYSTRKNNKNLKLKEFWTILSETRHSTTHSNSIIKISTVRKTDYHFSVFNYFFDSYEIDEESLQINLNYTKLNDLIKTISEFAFLIFKLISTKEQLDWDILIKSNVIPVNEDSVWYNNL